MDIYDGYTEEQLKNFKPTRLYVKQHTKTGMLYFGKTIRDDIETYLGSGKYWLKHIRKHGKEYVETLFITDWYFSYEEISKDALNFSRENDILNSKDSSGKRIWANLKEEDGLCGGLYSNEFKEILKTKIKYVNCEYCNKKVPNYAYSQFHGEYCIHNPNISQENIKKRICHGNKSRENLTSSEFKEKYKQTCKYCGLTTHVKTIFDIYHGEKCKLNPNISQESINYKKEISDSIREGRKLNKDKNKTTCEYCGKTVVNHVYAWKHGEKCKLNPNIDENIVLEEKARIEKMKILCIHCGKKVIPVTYYRCHGDMCKENKTPSTENLEYWKTVGEKSKSLQQSTEYIEKHSITCEHCGKYIFRWKYDKYHGDKCKYKKL